MAKGRRKPKVKHKHKQAIAKIAVAMIVEDQVPDCEALFAAAEAIAQLIAENCPIARPVLKLKY